MSTLFLLFLHVFILQQKNKKFPSRAFFAIIEKRDDMEELLTREQKMNFAILGYMVGKVGRYISFSELQQFSVEEQYKIVTYLGQLEQYPEEQKYNQLMVFRNYIESKQEIKQR